MPTHKFIITIIGGTWNGTTITKFSEEDKNWFIGLIKENYGVDCSVEKLKIY
jgi:hypothetical protein